MKGMSIIIFCALVFFYMPIHLGYSQGDPALEKVQPITSDVNKDGKPDVTYYNDGTYVTKAEADTNYDGKPDVIVHVKDGHFASAEVDTDYDGKTDEKFTDAKAFNAWLNKNRPDFKDQLGWEEWKVALLKF